MTIIEVTDDFSTLAPTWEDIPDAVWSGTRTYTVGGGALTVTIGAGGDSEDGDMYRVSRGTLQRNDVEAARLPLSAQLDLKVVVNDPTTTDEGITISFGFVPEYDGPDDGPVENNTGFEAIGAGNPLQFNMSISRRRTDTQWRYAIHDRWSTTAPGHYDNSSYNGHGYPYIGWDRPYYRLEKTGTTTRVSNSADGVTYTELYSHTAPYDFAGSYYVRATNQLFIGEGPTPAPGVVPTPIKAQIQVLSDHYWNPYNHFNGAYTATTVLDDFYLMIEPYPEYSGTPNLGGTHEGTKANFSPAAG